MDTLGSEQPELDQPVFTARDMLELRWRLSHQRPTVQPPRAAILCYQPELLRYIIWRYAVRKVRGFSGDLYLFRRTKGRVAMAGKFGIGAPSAVMMLEELAAFGVREFLSIGVAGGLQEDLPVGSLVVCDAACSGEGTSSHYPSASGGALRADAELTRRMCAALERGGLPYRLGSAWTTDAPYRETRREVAEMQRDGVLAVDMEASALFAASQVLNVRVGAAFVISDSLVRPKGLAEFSLKVLLQRLPQLASTAMAVLSEKRRGVNPAIVVSAYNRPRALARLLESLRAVEYPADTAIPLVISIDHDGDPEVVDLARNFDWTNGSKQILLRKEHLGPVQHFLACGGLSQEYGAIIYLEDDLLVSPVFYPYASQALSFFAADPRIGGISLYALWFNGYTQEPFIPLADAADHFFVQVPYTQGQAFTADQWSAFQSWLESDGARSLNPDAIHSAWSHFRADEWFPLLARCLVATERYYVYPRVSLTSGFGDAGTHFAADTAFFQAPLQREKQHFAFKPLDESCAVYDSFFEMLPERLCRLAAGLGQYPLTLDLYATRARQNFVTEYALSTRPCRKAIQTYGMGMRPLEENVIHQVSGQGISLCRVEDLLWTRWAEMVVRKRKDDYFSRGRGIGIRRRLEFALVEAWERLRGRRKL